MKPVYRHLAFLAVLISISQSPALGADWPGWRGPRGDGTSLETNLPVKWSGSDNITWKTPLPGLGHSSPIIWSDRIFLTTAIAETKDRVLLCLDRKTGKILWRQTVVNAPLEEKQPQNSYASSTPVTDGEKVYCAFLDGKDVVVAAYDFAGGQKWISKPGQFDSQWGFCHSPVLCGGKLLMACCGRHSGFIAALDRRDGKKIWGVEPQHLVMAFSSPLVRQMAGRQQMSIQSDRRLEREEIPLQTVGRCIRR